MRNAEGGGEKLKLGKQKAKSRAFAENRRSYKADP